MAILDPRTWNLIKFLVTRSLAAAIIIFLTLEFTQETDVLRLLGGFVVVITLWRSLLSIYRRLIAPAKKPLEYGKWAIVTGSTSGIGKEFAAYLAKKKMSILLISRTESKLQDQAKELTATESIDVKYLAYDFTKMGPEKTKFYQDLDAECQRLHEDGGIGLLINNVGTANEIPKTLEEFTDQDVEDLINCNIFSTVWMTRTVLKYMKEKKNGAIVSISSGSGNHVGPYLVIYSATKAFMTQFSRSMHVECWGTGVDFLVVTPFYIVSNLYKRKYGTLIAPLPIELIKGTLAQLGKKYVWQGHGYWFHGLIGNFAHFYWGMTERYRKMMLSNRERYDKRMAEKAAEPKSS